MPWMHPREKLVRGASVSLRECLANWSATALVEELTTSEYISVLTGVTNDHLALFLKYEIRQERHGNVDRPGGLASDDED